MHRDKTVARILLILSVFHVAAAATAVLRQRYLDVDEDVTAASEKRGNSGNTPQDLHPVPQMDNDRPSASGTPQLDNDTPPASGAPQLHHDLLTEISSVHDGLPLGPEPDSHYPSSLHESEVPSLHEWEPLSINQFISDVKNNKLKYSVAFGVSGAAFSGFIYGLYKLSNHHSYVSAFFHPSPARTESQTF